MINWIDQKLLKLTELIAKKWNWLTGKDNFWLARFSLFSGGIIYSLCLALFIYRNMSGVMIASYAFCLFIAWRTMRLTYSYIKKAEKDAYKNMVNATLSLSKFLEFRRGRILFLFSSFPITILCLFVFRTIDNGLFVGIGNFFIFFPTAIAIYFISIPKPPFSKSRAWELLKDFAGKLVPRPQPQPALVPIRYF